MPEVVRVRESRYRDDFSSDDERSSYGRSSRPGAYRTVQRYRVTPTRVEDIDDTRSVRSVRSERVDRFEIPARGDRYEVDRRVERIERHDVGPRSERIEVDRRVDRLDIDRASLIERPRSAFIDPREPERERTRTVVYEREREPESPRPWDRDRPWEREREVDIRIDRRPRDSPPVELERYSRETEYFSQPEPAPQPIVIRQRPAEPQQIIVEAARTPAPIIVPREEVSYDVVRREQAPPPRREEEYYYSRDVREINGREDYDRRVVRRGSFSDDGHSSGSELVVRRERRVVRSRSGSSDHHKRHLAEGALAGAGAAAIIANHRSKTGSGGDHKAGKVASGAALGAIGAELVTRARSRYRESNRRSRSRSSSRHSHSKIKTGLGLAVAAVAAAGIGKYISDRNNTRREELGRGRSRTSSRRRHSVDGVVIESHSRSRSRHLDPKHRNSVIAKAGASAAAVAGVVEAIRARSKSRSGRSQSKLRTGTAIAATGLAGAAVASLYENRKAKQDAADEIRGRGVHSRSRSRGVSVYSEPGIDPELGLVEYGANPVYTTTEQRTEYNSGYNPAAAPAAVYATRSGRSRERSVHRSHSASRSRSRIRDLAAGAAATGAAAIGMDQYKKRRDRKAAERERRRFEDDAPENYYANASYDDGYSPSPPRASGGAFYPETNAFPPPPAGFVQHTTQSTTHVNEYPAQSYNPADYVHHAPQEHHTTRIVRENHVSQTPSPSTSPQDESVLPQSQYPTASVAQYEEGSHPEIPVSQLREANHIRSPNEDGRVVSRSISLSSLSSSNVSDELPHNKSVTFAPLSSTSTRPLAETKSTNARKRRNSDPSSDRPTDQSAHRRRHRNASRSPSPDVEVLPDRFDESGRPLDGSGVNRNTEMVERVVRDFRDVLDGKQSWKDMLIDLIDDNSSLGLSSRQRR